MLNSKNTKSSSKSRTPRTTEATQRTTASIQRAIKRTSIPRGGKRKQPDPSFSPIATRSKVTLRMANVEGNSGDEYPRQILLQETDGDGGNGGVGVSASNTTDGNDASSASGSVAIDLDNGGGDADDRDNDDGGDVRPGSRDFIGLSGEIRQNPRHVRRASGDGLPPCRFQYYDLATRGLSVTLLRCHTVNG